MSLNLSSNFLEFKIEMAKPSRHGIYEFDEFRLDAAKLMLYRDCREISAAEDYLILPSLAKKFTLTK